MEEDGECQVSGKTPVLVVWDIDDLLSLGLPDPQEDGVLIYTLQSVPTVVWAAGNPELLGADQPPSPETIDKAYARCETFTLDYIWRQIQKARGCDYVEISYRACDARVQCCQTFEVWQFHMLMINNSEDRISAKTFAYHVSKEAKK